VTHTLNRAGYETTTATGPLQALEIVTMRGGFDLVVTDVIMPEMCGSELAQQIRLLTPRGAVMLMSGCVANTERLPQGTAFLGKPFSAPDLLPAVEKALQGPPSDR
jgi:CheY-like chemotaxis protein